MDKISPHTINDIIVPIIRSGGQTGADRAALNWAISNGLQHCGWCPRGRRAEDGRISKQYDLTETSSFGYVVRTKKNVEDSDGTVLFSISPELSGGTLLTYEWAEKINKPSLLLYKDVVEPGCELRRFLSHYRIKDLNVAGPRKSTEPTIEDYVQQVLDECFRLNG